MKNKNLFLLLVFGLSVFSLSAQTDQEKIFEEKGEKLMKEAALKLKSFEAIKIDLTYKMENEAQNIVETMEGTLISQGEKYHMEIGDNLFISDGTTAWSYMEEIDEVHVNFVENTDGGLNPTSILEGFEKDFRSKFIRQETHKGKLVDIIDLVPSGPQAFFKYRVALDASTRMMVYVAAYDRQGGTYTYNLENIQSNPKIDDTLFTFNSKNYPGVEIIDLR